MLQRTATFALACALMVSVSTAPRHAWAQENAAAIEDARWAFVEGTTHYEAKRYEQALASFEHASALFQSPNTLLMLARSQRELGRRVDAALTFDRAAHEAKKRVAAGESKYAPTAQAATEEGQRVRAGLAVLRIHVEGQGASLKVDAKPIALPEDQRVDVLREPGMTTIELMSKTGSRQRQTVTLAPGATVSMAFGADTHAPPSIQGASNAGAPNGRADPNGTTQSTRPWATTGALVAGGVTLAGAGVFVGFGVSSQATYDRLKDRCGPNDCGPAERAEADRGKRDQAIANVGLGVALAAAAATVVFVILAVDAPKTTSKADLWRRASSTIVW